MPVFSLCVTGTQIFGGAQRLTVTASTLYDLNRALEDMVTVISPTTPDTSGTCRQLQLSIQAVSMYDREFDEYLLVNDIGELGVKAKVRLTFASSGQPLSVSSDPTIAARAAQQASYYAYVCDQILLPALEQAASVNATSLSNTLGDTFVQSYNKRQTKWEDVATLHDITAAIDRAVFKVAAAVNAIRADSGATTSAPPPVAVSSSSSRAYPPALNAAADERRNGFPTSPAAPVQQDAVVSSVPRKAARKALPPSAGGDVAATPAASNNNTNAAVAPPPPPPPASRIATTTTPTAAQRPLAAAVAPPPSSTAVALVGAGGDSMIVYCVYSGATTQRAKAVRVDRNRPYFEGLLQTLVQKFKSALSLGYIDPKDGAWVEILSSEDLRRVISQQPASADSITLHCWEKAPQVVNGAIVDDPADRASSVGKSPGRSSRRSAYGGRLVLGGSDISKIGPSAAAPRTGASSRHPLDVSGAHYTEEHLRELFNELDTSHDGTLDKEELRAMFLSRYDPMGIDNFEKRFEDMLKSLGHAFDDGHISFDEFSIVMLKLAQW